MSSSTSGTSTAVSSNAAGMGSVGVSVDTGVLRGGAAGGSAGGVGGVRVGRIGLLLNSEFSSSECPVADPRFS